MNTVFKKIVAKTYKPVLEKYLSKKRIYRYGDIRLEVPPEVFSPWFFFRVTQLLLQSILRLPLKHKQFAELGAGSGLIAILAAKEGADVWATDINPVALQYLQSNSSKIKLN
ncbi:MAG: 50S ribosomal protein L11 methyltransferase [Chitinophagaceae bacterium]